MSEPNIQLIEKLLSFSDLKEICIKYEHLRHLQTDEGFNLFYLISDTYYKENFHSDVIAAFLDRKEKHKAGDIYLMEFIKLINRYLIKKENKTLINPEKFKNTVVVREEGKIDIWIKDDVSHQAIIIENKINNALDMYRQLPTYYTHVEEAKYEVVAIVYLPLDNNKRPKEDGWTIKEKENINSKLVIIASYDEGENDLLNGWIKPCIAITNEIDALSILRQYSKLIKNLRENVMNEQLFEDFYKVAKGEDDFQTAKSFSKMISDFPNYLAKKIINNINDAEHLFGVVDNKNLVAADIKIGKETFHVHIDCSLNEYNFRLWDKDYENLDDTPLLNVKKLQDLLKEDWNYTTDEMTKVFKFPEEEEKLYFFIKSFITKIKNISPNSF